MSSTTNTPSFLSTNAAPKRRRRSLKMQRAISKGSALGESGLDTSSNPVKGVKHPPKTIPIVNRLTKTQSELQLQEDIAACEWRDLAMFHRLVSGMRDRQRVQQQREIHRIGVSCQLASSADENQRALLQTDRCVENIIWTRRQEIDLAKSLSLEDDFLSALPSTSAAQMPGRRSSIADRRFSNGRAVSHTEAYGQFIDGEGRSSAPPPLFPDLDAALKEGSRPIFGPGPAIVADTNASDSDNEYRQGHDDNDVDGDVFAIDV